MEMTKQMIGAIIRYFLAMLAGWLVTQGIVPAELADAWLGEVVPVLVGVVVLGVILGWRWFNARFNVLALIRAVQQDPPADDPAEVQAAIAEVKADVAAAPQTTIPY